MKTRCWRMPDSILERTGVSVVRYAQVWEDADVLLAGLDVRPGDACVSIASAGDNTLALLTKRPSRVVAIDVSAAQLACLELRVAAYRALQHEQLLELIGSRPSVRRASLFAQCRPLLSSGARAFWDRRGSGHRWRHRRCGPLRTLLRPLPPMGAASHPRSRNGCRSSCPAHS